MLVNNKMKDISDILKYDKKVKITNTTNFLVDIRERLDNLTQIINMVDNYKYNITLYALIKLDFVWASEFERIGLKRQNVKNIIIRLINLDFVEEIEKTQTEYNIIVDKLGVKTRDYSNVILYKLTNKGYNYLATKEIYDSLLLLLKKEHKDFVTETFKEMNK